MTTGIYRIVNTATDKQYFGSSQNIEKRFQRHRRDLIRNQHHNTYLQRSWNKHGAEVFQFEIIEVLLDTPCLFTVEQIYIDNNQNGYNFSPAGGGDNLSNHPDRDTIIAKITETIRNRYSSMTHEERIEVYSKPGNTNPNYVDGRCADGRPCPICGSRIDYHSRAKTCSECRDRNGPNNSFFGKKHSDEMKERARERRLGSKQTAETRLKVTGEKSGRFIGYYHTPWGTFPSSSQAERSHGFLKSATIHRWCLNSDSTITRTGKSPFLKEIGPSCIGKTYRCLGFWFEPRQPLASESLGDTCNLVE